VLVPCLDEAATIGGVVARFQASLPGCVVHVYDNGSTDDTARLRREVAVMEERWGSALTVDPAHSPNLALDGDGFTTAAVPRVTPPWRA